VPHHRELEIDPMSPMSPMSPMNPMSARTHRPCLAPASSSGRAVVASDLVVVVAAIVAAVGAAGALGCVAPGSAAVDDSLPPVTSAAAVEAWLATGSYLTWQCEAAPHASRDPRHQVQSRVCNNRALASTPGDAAEVAVDAASVRELWNLAGTELVGLALNRHTRAGAGADTWFWYERAFDAPALLGWPIAGAPPATCSGCHATAGRGANPGRSFVFTLVQGAPDPVGVAP
jgi:hypothetical protein